MNGHALNGHNGVVGRDGRHCGMISPPEVLVPFGSPYRSKPILIGISGATNGGKTTVANRLLAAFPGSEIIHQDDFFREVGDPHHEHVKELNHHNWDTFSAVHVDALIETAKRKLHDLEASMSKEATDLAHPTAPVSPKLLIIEGILILNIEELHSILDRKFYFTLTFEECLRRRLTRNYDPPDVPGYFQQIVWPMHLKLAGELRKQHNDIDYISGVEPSGSSFQYILADIQKFLNESDAVDKTIMSRDTLNHSITVT